MPIHLSLEPVAKWMWLNWQNGLLAFVCSPSERSVFSGVGVALLVTVDLGTSRRAVTMIVRLARKSPCIFRPASVANVEMLDARSRVTDIACSAALQLTLARRPFAKLGWSHTVLSWASLQTLLPSIPREVFTLNGLGDVDHLR